MRLHVLSDLHIDHLQNRRRLPELAREMAQTPADALVVAGDISHKLEQVEEALRQLVDLAPTRMFVAGNHDIWRVRPKPTDPSDSWARLDALSEAARRHGFHPLEEANLDVLGFTFVGSIAWYDYSFASPAMPMNAEEYADKRWRDLTYMDREYAAWGIPDAEVNERLCKGIESRLGKATRPVVFCSHHVPLRELVLRRGVDSWDFFNAYMGSRRLEDLLRARAVQRFVFGHTHRPVTLVEPGRFVINNPVGYPRQALNPVRTPFDVS